MANKKVPPPPKPISRERLKKRFGRIVREKREALGLTQRELSIRIYGSPARGNIAQIERGGAGITLYTLFVLARALDCMAEDLVPVDDITIAE